jgi:2-polyprenyl-6-methoxyphenol hydroxylase-like FAD-dependent oxidoreductase
MPSAKVLGTPEDISLTYDVVIAGAGPVGLFLACELRLAELSVLVLEEAKDPTSPLKRLPLGRRGLWASTIEAFDRRGLLSSLDNGQVPPLTWAAPLGSGSRPPGERRAGHFAGIPFYLDLVDSSRWKHRLPSSGNTHLSSTTEQIESVLIAHANALEITIRRGLAVENFVQSDEDVTITAGGDTFRARWLVGCDGGRSTVRKKGGFEFVGTDPEFTGYSAQVEMAEPELLPMGLHYTPTGIFAQHERGTIAIADFDRGAFHRTQPLTLEHIQAVLRRISGIDVTLTAMKVATTFTDRAYQATTYRKGRVLLAGDAAHIHSPLGGQGLNLGLGDAMNLGWKLAATIGGDAPSNLLDTYTSERHPIGAQILNWSRAQVSLMRPNSGSRAIAAIIRDLIDTRDGTTYFAERVWGLTQRYELGSDHPLVGRSVPDFELIDGRKIGEFLTEGHGLFLDFEGRTSLEALATRWKNLTYISGVAKDCLGLSSVLVRPDGIVAWASDAGHNQDEIMAAASRWFGDH